MAEAGKRMLDDASGKRSSMRILWTLVVLLVMGVWAFISISTLQVAALGYDLVALIIFLSGGKVAQTMVEKGDFSLKLGNK